MVPISMVSFERTTSYYHLTIILAWTSHLASAVPTCQGIPMMHVSLLSVEHGVPWTIITPHEIHKPLSMPSRSSPKEAPLIIDTSTSTWAMYPSTPFPLSSSPMPNYNTDLTYIPDPTENHAPSGPPTPPLLPISSTVLIRTSSSSSAPTMLYLHLLYTIQSPSSSLSIPDMDTHRDITRNYHELTVLSSLRWQLGASEREGLPLHLAAVEVMREALDIGEAGSE
jgi:mediator of RNA polymerase II transcription subunit 13, fungi type